MFAFLGTAYATSIRLSAIEGFTPLKTSIAFVLLNGMALVQMPLTARVMERYNPKWLLGGGCRADGRRRPLAGRVSRPPTCRSRRSSCRSSSSASASASRVSSLTAVAVNTVPNHLAGHGQRHH